ncbi:MAG: hypothetical protein ACLT0Y_07465 [Christensenellales bacterium]
MKTRLKTKNIAQTLLHKMETLVSAYHQGLALLSCRQEDTADGVRMVAKVLNLIAQAPCMQASWFDVRKNAEIAPLVDKAIEHSAKINALTEEILNSWEPPVFTLDADGMLARFKTE